MPTDIGKAYVQIVPSADGISGKISEILGGESKNAGTSFGSQFGSFATKAVTALGVGKAISDSVSNGMEFETAFAKASTLFSGTSSELSNFQTEIMRISSETGVAASQLAEAAYSAESASVPMGNLGAMIESSSKLATAGFTDIDTALSATAKTMNAYGMMSDDVATTQANMDKVQRVLIQTQNKGITTVGELGASLAQVTPTASAFGVSFEQVGASLAGMTAQGTPTAQATTQLNALIAELGKNGTTAANNLAAAAENTQYAGMSFTEMMASGADLNDVLDLMQGYADDNNLAMVDMFSSIEAGKAAMSINSSDWTGNLEAMATEADVVGEAFGTMADTSSFKLTKLKNTLSNMGIEAFTAVSDSLTSALESLGGILEGIWPAAQNVGSAFMEVVDSAAQVVGEMLGLDDGFSTSEAIIAGVSTVLDGISTALQFVANHMNTIVPILGTVVAAFAAMQVISTIVTIVNGFSMAFTFLLSPVGLVVAAIAAAVAIGVLLGQNWDAIKEKAGELKDKIAEKFEGVKEAFNSLKEKAGEIKDAIAEKFDAVKEKVSEAFNNVKETMGTVMQAAKDAVQEKLDNIKTAYEEHGGGVGGVVAAGMEAIKGYYTTGYTFIDNLTGGKLSSILSSVQGKMESVKSAVSDKLNSVKTYFSDKLSSALDTARSKFDSIKTAVSDKLNSAKTAVSDKLGSIKTAFSDKLGGALDTVRSKFDSIKNAISDKLSAARDKVQSLIDSIKSKFNFSWSLPHLKLPHPWISGSFSLNPPSVPSFGISWYAKAMDTPYMFDRATLFGAGETGDEMLYGRSSLMQDIREAVRAESNHEAASQMTARMEQIIDYLAALLKGQGKYLVLDTGELVGATVNQYDEALGRIRLRGATR